MSLQKMSFIGVITDRKKDMAFMMLKTILIENKYIPIYKNKKGNIIFYQKNDSYIGLMEISPAVAEGLLDLDFNFQILIHTFLKDKNYHNYALQQLFKKTRNFIILNMDEKESINLIKNNKDAFIITYGFNKKSTATASSVKINNYIHFNFCLQRRIITLKEIAIEPFELPMKLNLIGRWNIYYALAAILAAICYDIEINTETFSSIKNLNRKYEKIYEKDFLIVDNYCRNLSDLNDTFETVQNLKYKELVLILGIEIDEGIASIKKYLDSLINWSPTLGIKKILVYLDNENKLLEDNIKLMLNREDIIFSIYYDLDLCISEGLKLSDKNDILLLTGGESLNIGKNIINSKLANKFS